MQLNFFLSWTHIEFQDAWNFSRLAFEIITRNLANIQRGNRKEEMSDAREYVEAIIDRLLDEMELKAKIEMREQVNFGRM